MSVIKKKLFLNVLEIKFHLRLTVLLNASGVSDVHCVAALDLGCPEPGWTAWNRSRLARTGLDSIEPVLDR